MNRLLTIVALVTFLLIIGSGFFARQILPEGFLLAVLWAAVLAGLGWFGAKIKLTPRQAKPGVTAPGWRQAAPWPNCLHAVTAWCALHENSPTSGVPFSADF